MPERFADFGELWTGLVTTSPSGRLTVPGRSRTLGRLIVVAACLAFLLGLGLGLRVPPRHAPEVVPSERAVLNPLAPAYLGDEGCVRCHPHEGAVHARSGHSHTFLAKDLALAFPTLAGREATDPERTGTIGFLRRGNDLVAEYRSGPTKEELPIQCALGSGNHAVTFLTLLPSRDGEPRALEHRFSLFDHGQTLALTPSHRGESIGEPIERFGRLHRGRDVQGCVRCHTVTGQTHETTIDDLRAGVGCESCHGPGRAHAAAMTDSGEGGSLRFGKGTESALEEVRMCGRCHRMPDMIVPPAPTDDPKLARFQPVGLLNSACFQKSEGALRCSTCHDPHAPTDREPTHYAAICLKCHSADHPAARVCPKSASERCIECHMPAVEVHPRVLFHDHWIRVRDKSPSPESRVP